MSSNRAKNKKNLPDSRKEDDRAEEIFIECELGRTTYADIIAKLQNKYDCGKGGQKLSHSISELPIMPTDLVVPGDSCYYVITRNDRKKNNSVKKPHPTYPQDLKELDQEEGPAGPNSSNHSQKIQTENSAKRKSYAMSEAEDQQFMPSFELQNELQNKKQKIR